MTLTEAVVHRAAHASALSRRAAARQLFLRRCALASAAKPGARISVRVHPTAFVHPRVRLDVWADTESELVIDADVRIGELSLLSLRGGRLRLGEGTEVRRFTTFHVAGDLDVGPRVLVSTGTALHCTERIQVGADTLLSEGGTVTDSFHVLGPAAAPVRHAIGTRPTTIGANCWLGARVTVAAGVTIGDQCIVGSGAVVTRDVPDGWLAAGVPARQIRQIAPVD